MLYTRTNPVGIDKAIGAIQEKLYKNLGFDSIDGYGRIYTIEKDGNEIPAHFIGGTDYREVLFNDRGNGNFFFYEEPKINVRSSQYEATLNLVFQLDVNRLTENKFARNDEEILAKIQKVLKGTSFRPSEIFKGQKALEDFGHNLRDRRLLFLRFRGALRYQINC